MAVLSYVRVSTQMQADEGLSLDAQERQIHGYALMKNLKIDHQFRERAVSGAKPLQMRPEGKKLVEMLQPGDVVLVAKLDRMFRSAQDALTVSEQFRKMGVSLHLLDLGGDVTGNGVAKMFFTIVAAFAEFERDRIAERISDVKRNERDKGRFLGGAKPFGYLVTESGALIPNEAEQRAVREVRRLRSEGMSYRDIARNVSENHSRISYGTVCRILSAGSEAQFA